NGPHQMRAYRGPDHRDTFLPWCVRAGGQSELIELPRSAAFAMIEVNAATLSVYDKDVVARDRLFNLLWQHFPEPMVLYGYCKSPKTAERRQL
ncbi:MAG: hypothetical protein ACREHG_06245, partial [Candidatus Saccharimonadales bacterium]